MLFFHAFTKGSEQDKRNVLNKPSVLLLYYQHHYLLCFWYQCQPKFPVSSQSLPSSPPNSFMSCLIIVSFERLLHFCSSQVIIKFITFHWIQFNPLIMKKISNTSLFKLHSDILWWPPSSRLFQAKDHTCFLIPLYVVCVNTVPLTNSTLPCNVIIISIQMCVSIVCLLWLSMSQGPLS